MVIKALTLWALLWGACSTPSFARAEETLIGVRLRLGWKYDDVRVCGATAPGAPHGPEVDVSLFADLALGGEARLDLDLPIMRPVVFALGGMLQIEPEATLLYPLEGEAWRAGPSRGLSLHHGPDHHSSPEAPTPAFFAIGPRIGGALSRGAPSREGELSARAGLRLFATPLTSIHDPQRRGGWVLGGALTGAARVAP